MRWSRQRDRPRLLAPAQRSAAKLLTNAAMLRCNKIVPRPVEARILMLVDSGKPRPSVSSGDGTQGVYQLDQRTPRRGIEGATHERTCCADATCSCPSPPRLFPKPGP